MISEEAVAESNWRVRAANTKKTRTLNKILLSAQKLFESCDYDEVSIEKIAAGAAVGPATIYQRFATKGALAAAVLAKSISGYDDLVEQDINSIGVLGALHAHLERLANLVKNNYKLARAVFIANSFTEGPPTSPHDPRLLLPLPRHVAQILDRGVQQGLLHVPTTPNDTAGSIVSALLVRIVARDETAKQSSDFIFSLITTGLLVEKDLIHF